MAHIRKPLGIAVALNTGIFAVEIWGGLRAHSLALVVDAAHNLSDELALICLWLAYTLVVTMSRGLQRTANLLNSVGLVAISGVVVWQAIDRIIHPRPVIGWIPVAIGLLAAAGNFAVARTLREWRETNAAIRLAYLHNLGDTYVSLAPVVAGLLVSVFQAPIFDPLMALLLGLWLAVTTVAEVRRSAIQLLWPENAVCPHDHLSVSRPEPA
jgi:cation diffusion facilitator family transporter